MSGTASSLRVQGIRTLFLQIGHSRSPQNGICRASVHVGVNSLLTNSTLYHPLVNMRKPLGFAGLLAICWPYMHTARLVRVLGEWMKNFLSGAMLIAGFTLATSAQAAPGECSVSGYDTFACDVSVDGGGITFELPDGKMFVFSQTVVGEGLGYLI